MRARVFRLLSCVTALMCVASALSAQYLVTQPGSRQPAALTTPRIAPLPEAQWTDVQKQLVAKYAIDGRADNRR